MSHKFTLLLALTLGLSILGVQPAIAQKSCNKNKGLTAQRDCWVARVKHGQKNLQGALLSAAELNGIALQGANLEAANLSWAQLTGANFSKANLNGAILKGANLGGANLNHAKLTGADLSGANLEGADLRGADFSDNLLHADLSGASFIGADLTGALLDDAYIKDAVASYSTTKGVDFSDWEYRGGIMVD